MKRRRDTDQVAGGIFLIGLALLFITGFWWPGIMFVIGASMIGRSLAEGRQWNANTGALWVIGIGLVFWLPGVLPIGISVLPLLLIGLGLFMLFGGRYRPHLQRLDDEVYDKPKNTDYIALADEDDEAASSYR